MLGLHVSKSGSGIVVVKNKPSRMDELATNLESLIGAGKVDPKKLPSLFGRALFVESQIAGRLGKLALFALRDLERRKRNVVSFDSIQLNALKVLLGRYRDSVPRILKFDNPRSPILLCTDGACESVGGELLARVGGVLFHPEMQSWMDADKNHRVSLTELYAVCLSRSLWKRRLNDEKVIVFIDNQGVLDGCIKGWSGEEQLKNLLLHFEVVDAQTPLLPWFARGPSSSNCADCPSPGLWSKLKQLVGVLGRMLHLLRTFDDTCRTCCDC